MTAEELEDLRVSEICYGTMRYASKTGERDERSEAAAAVEESPRIDGGPRFSGLKTGGFF